MKITRKRHPPRQKTDILFRKGGLEKKNPKKCRTKFNMYARSYRMRRASQSRKLTSQKRRLTLTEGPATADVSRPTLLFANVNRDEVLEDYAQMVNKPTTTLSTPLRTPGREPEDGAIMDSPVLFLHYYCEHELNCANSNYLQHLCNHWKTPSPHGSEVESEGVSWDEKNDINSDI